jgi:hypothetical protein
MRAINGLRSSLTASARIYKLLLHCKTLERKKKMEYSKFKNDASVYESTARAEDGMPPRSRWNALCEGVLIPLGSLFAVFLAMLGLMLIAD